MTSFIGVSRCFQRVSRSKILVSHRAFHLLSQVTQKPTIPDEIEYYNGFISISQCDIHMCGVRTKANEKTANNQNKRSKCTVKGLLVP